MALISLVPFDLAGTGLLEPFGCAFVCLHFRHVVLFKGSAIPFASLRVLRPRALLALSGARSALHPLQYLWLISNCFFLRPALGPACRSSLLLLRLLRPLFRFFGARYLLRGRQDHVHGVSFHARPELYNSFVAHFFHQPVKNFPAKVLVGHFASAEAQAGFYFVALSQEAEYMISLGDVIMLVHVHAELNFLQDDLLLVLLGRAFLFFILVEELAVIHDAAHWRHRVGRNLYQVKVLFPGPFGSIEGSHDAQLVAIGINHANLPRADAVIHANKALVDSILLLPIPPNGWQKRPLQLSLGDAAEPARSRENYNMANRPGTRRPEEHPADLILRD